MDIMQDNKIKFRLEGRTLWICPGEDLDHHNAEYIRKTSDKLLEKHPINKVVFDFAEVEFMDSSGIGVVMGRYKQMLYAGGAVYVCGIGAGVDRIFQMTGLYKLVRRMEDENHAE